MANLSRCRPCVTKPQTAGLQYVAHEPAHSNGCAPLPKRTGRLCSTRVRIRLKKKKAKIRPFQITSH
jgi:hypothetical protein